MWDEEKKGRISALMGSGTKEWLADKLDESRQSLRESRGELEEQATGLTEALAEAKREGVLLRERLAEAEHGKDELAQVLAQRDEQITGLTEALAEAEASVKTALVISSSDGESGAEHTLDILTDLLYAALKDDKFRGSAIELTEAVCAALAETRDKVEGAVQIAENFEADATFARDKLKEYRDGMNTGGASLIAKHDEITKELVVARSRCAGLDAELDNIVGALDMAGVVDHTEPVAFPIFVRVKLALEQAGCQGDSKPDLKTTWLKKERDDARADIALISAELRTIRTILDRADVLEHQRTSPELARPLECHERVALLAEEAVKAATVAAVLGRAEGRIEALENELEVYEGGAKGFVLCAECATAPDFSLTCAMCLQNRATVIALEGVRDKLDRSVNAHTEEIERAKGDLTLATTSLDNERGLNKQLTAEVLRFQHVLNGVSLGVAMALGKVNQ